MTFSIPPEAVEAAARAFEPDTWSPLANEAYRADARENAEVALTAALPILYPAIRDHLAAQPIPENPYVIPDLPRLNAAYARDAQVWSEGYRAARDACWAEGYAQGREDGAVEERDHLAAQAGSGVWAVEMPAERVKPGMPVWTHNRFREVLTVAPMDAVSGRLSLTFAAPDWPAPHKLGATLEPGATCLVEGDVQAAEWKFWKEGHRDGFAAGVAASEKRARSIVTAAISALEAFGCDGTEQNCPTCRVSRDLAALLSEEPMKPGEATEDMA